MELESLRMAGALTPPNSEPVIIINGSSSNMTSKGGGGESSNVVVVDARSAGGGSNNKRMRRGRKEQQLKKEAFSHFFVHIPKSGASYALLAINELIWPSPKWNALKAAPNQQFWGCNEFTTSTSLLRERYLYQYRGLKCTLWMSEGPYMEMAQHNYIVV
jgi:hypothetical protein